MAAYALPGIFVMGCLVYFMEPYVIRCPEQSEWNIRAEIQCQNITKYFCLYNYIHYTYEEGCTEPEWDVPGKKRVYSRNFNNAPCNDTRYQPIKFETNGSSDCIFRKSLCTEEGQTLLTNGSTKTDSTCRCDYKQGYAFVTVPRNNCSCRPSEEDCSCYVKKCQEIGYNLSADYECTKDVTKKTVCLLMSENPSEDPHIDMAPTGTPREYDSYAIKRTCDVAILVSIFFLVIIVITICALFHQRLPRCPCLFTNQFITICALFHQRCPCLFTNQSVITKHLENVTCIEDQSLSLVCELAEKDISVIWLKDEKVIEASNNIVPEIHNNAHILKFKKLSQNDGGKYALMAEGKKTEAVVCVIAKSTIPDQILQMDEKDKAMYLEIIKSGTEQRCYIRLMIVGENGVGKTCLMRRLLREDIDDVTSTNGIDVVICKCKIRISDGKWIINKENTVEQDKKVRMKRALTDKDSISPEEKIRDKQAESLLEDAPMETTVTPFGNVKGEEIKNVTEIKDIYTGKVMDQKNDVDMQFTNELKEESIAESVPLHTDKDVALKSEKRVELSDTLSDAMNVELTKDIFADCDVWDFAGQKEFYATHQTFLTNSAIYLLTADLSKDLSSQIQTKICDVDFDKVGCYIDFWFDTIHCYATESPDQSVDKPTLDKLEPPIIIVCTGTDKIKGELIEQKYLFEKQLNSILGEQSKRKHWKHIHYLSNKTLVEEDFGKLRSTIFETAKTMSSWRQKLPLRWIHLETALDGERNAGSNILPFDLVVKLAKESSLPTSDNEEIFLFLRYQHECGHVIFFKDLSDYIILNPRWLIDVFKCFVSAHQFLGDLPHLKDWKELEETGKLSNNLISKLLEKLPKLTFVDYKEHLLRVLEKFDIIVKPSHIENTEYYLPCMIKSSSFDVICHNFGVHLPSCHRTSWLLLEFEFLPPAFFNHVLVGCIRKFNVHTEDGERLSLYRGIGVFDIDKLGNRKLVICEHKNLIAFQIWIYNRELVRAFHNYRHTLTDMVDKLRERYQICCKYKVKLKCRESDYQKAKGRFEFKDLQDGKTYYCPEHGGVHACVDLYECWFSGKYPEGYLEAQAKEEEEAGEVTKKEKRKRDDNDSSPSGTPEKKKVVGYEIDPDQLKLIKEDEGNTILWNEAKVFTKEGAQEPEKKPEPMKTPAPPKVPQVDGLAIKEEEQVDPEENDSLMENAVSAPGPPINIKANVLPHKRIEVSWLPPTDSTNISSYNVYFSDSSENQEHQRVIGHPKNNFILEGLIPDTVYHIQMSATSNGREGEKSTIIEVKTSPLDSSSNPEKIPLMEEGAARTALLDDNASSFKQAKAKQEDERMAEATISRHELNYIKITMLVLKICPRAVRVQFDKEFNPVHLQRTLNRNIGLLKDLQMKKRITQPQWNLLFPRTGEPSSKDFDMILMIFLLRNLIPIGKMNRLPSATDTSVEADLSRIMHYRNIIVHCHIPMLDDTVFESYWNDVTLAILRLGGNSLKAECDYLYGRNLDAEQKVLVETNKKLIELEQEQRTELAETKKKLIELEQEQSTELAEGKKKLIELEQEQSNPVPKTIREFIGKSTEHTKSTNCLMSTTSLLMILMMGNVDKGIVQQLRFQHFQKMNLNRISVLVEKNVQPLRFLTRKHVQILESNRNSLFDEETVQQLRLPIGKSFQRKESNQNSVLDFEFSCYFEPMVNVKRHGSNEEYYNFDQEENKNQENIKRTDHDPKGEDSNMEDMFCEIETEKVGHLQETTEGHKFIESVSEVDHGKKLIDHSSNFDCEVGDIDGDHEFFYAMERSETEIDKINYERSTTNDVYSNETIILTDLLHSTPVDGDHEFFDAMERSETEIDEINYERSTANDVYSNETIIQTDLLHSTPVMFSNETINLKDLSRSTPVEGNHLSTKKSIHEETNVKRLVCNDTTCCTCSLDEDNHMRVELEDLADLSVDEFNITQDNDIGSRNVFDYIRSIEIEDDDEPFCRSTKSLSIDRYSNRVWSLLDYHMIPELNKDYQVIPELNKGDISNTSMKSDSEFASNSLKNGSDNGSLLSSCSCNVDAHVFNCQVVSPHSFVNDSNNDMQSSRTVIDIQKRQKSKSHAHIVDSKKKPLLKGMINENVPTTEDVCRIVRNIIETTKQKSISNLTKKSCRKCFSSYRKKPRRRLTRRRLRRLIYPHRNISHVHVDIEARPLLNASERNATTNGPGNGLNNVEAAALATSQRCLTTSLPSSSNSLNNYFSKLLSGYEFSTDEKMQFEMIRVQSFQDLPASCNVSPLRLARTGFFSSGSGDEVTCFSCGVKYKGWQNNDNPNDVHRRISSDCRMVNGRETRNIPVSQQHNGIIEHSGQQESLAHTTNDFAQSTVHFDGDVSTQTTEATQNREMTREEVVKSNFSDNIQQSTNIKPPVDQPYSRQPALDRTNPDQQYARQPATDRASSVPDQNRPAQSAEDLGINLDKPKYPAYAQLNVRVSTFQGWPGYLDQTPRDMALAGFFYAGYNDYCRCFFCGGGLRNWDSGDDPWVEHTRWFPKCVFVQQNRGRRFVEIIVKRQAEMQASGNSVGNTKNQRAIKTQIGTVERSETSSQTSSQSADSNSTIDPAKASVRELGYADEIIDRAITIIKQNNPSKQKIEATDIMEVIFTITEDSETNTAVASENTPSSELNLPSTSQAVPQSNVSSQSNQPMSHSSQSNKPLVSKPNQPTAVASQSTNASENSLPSLSVSSLEHGNAAAVKSTSKEISENEIRSLQEENIQLKEQVMCKICMDKNVSIAFLPCGHLACCIDCAPAMRKCPMCRVYIKGTVKTFLA